MAWKRPCWRMVARHGARVWLALGTLYLVWGSTFIALAIVVRDQPPLLAMSVRHLIAGTILLAFALPRGDRAGDRIGRAQIGAALVFGGLLFVTGHGVLAWAQQTVPAGVAALLVGSIPIWMALLDRVAFGRRLPRSAYLGFALGFIGLAFLFDPFGEGSIDRLAALAIVLSAMCWAAGSLYSRGAPLPKRPLVSAGLASVCGGVLLLVSSTIAGELGEADWSRRLAARARVPGRRRQSRRLHDLRLAAALGADVARRDIRVRQPRGRGHPCLGAPRRGDHSPDGDRGCGGRGLGGLDRPVDCFDTRAWAWPAPAEGSSDAGRVRADCIASGVAGARL